MHIEGVWCILRVVYGAYGGLCIVHMEGCVWCIWRVVYGAYGECIKHVIRVELCMVACGGSLATAAAPTVRAAFGGLGQP